MEKTLDRASIYARWGHGFRSGIRIYVYTDTKQRVMYCYTHIQFGKWLSKE